MAKKKSVTNVKLNNFWKNNKIFFIVLFIILIIGYFVFLSGKSTNVEQEEFENLPFGDDVIVMYYFHANGCQYCIKQNAFHNELYVKYPNLKIMEYEVSESGTRDKLLEVSSNIEGFNVDAFGTPTSFIGKEFNIGFGSNEVTGQRLIDMIEIEQKRIDDNWDETTMTRTIDLRSNLN